MGEGEVTRLADAGGIGCVTERADRDGRTGAKHHGWLLERYPPLVDATAGALLPLAGFFGPPHL